MKICSVMQVSDAVPFTNPKKCGHARLQDCTFECQLNGLCEAADSS